MTRPQILPPLRYCQPPHQNHWRAQVYITIVPRRDMCRSPLLHCRSQNHKDQNFIQQFKCQAGNKAGHTIWFSHSQAELQRTVVTGKASRRQMPMHSSWRCWAHAHQYFKKSLKDSKSTALDETQGLALVSIRIWEPNMSWVQILTLSPILLGPWVNHGMSLKSHCPICKMEISPTYTREFFYKVSVLSTYLCNTK